MLSDVEKLRQHFNKQYYDVMQRIQERIPVFDAAKAACEFWEALTGQEASRSVSYDADIDVRLTVDLGKRATVAYEGNLLIEFIDEKYGHLFKPDSLSAKEEPGLVYVKWVMPNCNWLNTATFSITFNTGAACEVVQVGTKITETPIYETRCK